MEIRPLRESEKEHYGRAIQFAFQLPESFLEDFIQIVELENTRGIFDDKNRLLAGLRILRNRMWLGPRQLEMAGITSVATPPEYRRQGYLKQLLQMVLHEEREQGRNISSLYPFEFPFYRKFGYELASVNAEVKVKIGALAAFKSRTEGEWQEASPDDWQLFKSIYDQYCQGRFGRIERDSERQWKRRVFTLLTLPSEGPERPRNLFIWRDSQGQARAYIVYSFKTLEQPWERELQVRDMAWLDEAARHEIYCFMANHDSQAIRVAWDTETNDEIFSRLIDPRQAEIKLEPSFMLRLLDVERALVERAWPTDHAVNFSLKVQDDVLAWNHDRPWQVQIKQGRAEVSESREAGLECDVRTLAQLYTGYLAPKQAARLGKLTVNRAADLEAAQQAFTPADQPAPYMADFW